MGEPITETPDPEKLFTAIFDRDATTAESLIRNHPEFITASRTYGVTPLYAASRKRMTDIVALLLKMGADPNVELTGRGEDFVEGDTPVIGAIVAFSTECLHLLTQHGANLNFQNDWWYCPLTAAIERHQRESVACLLEAGADPNYDLGNGFRVLHFAVMHDGHEDDPYFTRILLQYGADPRARTLPCIMGEDEQAFQGRSGKWHADTPIDLATPGTPVHDLLLAALAKG